MPKQRCSLHFGQKFCVLLLTLFPVTGEGFSPHTAHRRRSLLLKGKCFPNSLNSVVGDVWMAVSIRGMLERNAKLAKVERVLLQASPETSSGSLSLKMGNWFYT